MATELGKAYVQIMPSAKGISGSIQKTINPEATKAGKSAGTRIASSIADSMGKAGKTLTKAITLPALGAATAVAGITAAFGWKRLVGLDSARAQLQGLGYDAESVERISSQVNDAIQGTVTTMAEGVSIAAGGLAAGVKEGAELEKYIQLVGDAAVGANRPVADMAQIFNRVQGSGKLMTMELNMIEQGMPGFAAAMSKHFKVPQDEFRELVTAGEVSSKDFLKVMDSFAGQMSGAYANSWQGLVSNTKAWIGIIGENILSGVFEQSKESIAEFMDFLKSDDVQAWAKETGATIGEAFTNLIGNVKDAITWWTELDGSTKKLIGKIAGIAIVIGPILMIISKITSLIISLIPAFKILGAAIGLLTSPIGLVVAAIVAAAALIYIYWEPIKGFFISLWKSIKDITLKVWDSLKKSWIKAVEFLKTTWESVSEFFLGIWESIKGIFMLVWKPIQNVWNEVAGFIREIWLDLSEFFSFLWADIKEVMLEVWKPIQVLWSKVVKYFVGLWNIYVETIKIIWDVITEIFMLAWETISDIVTVAVDVILDVVGTAWEMIVIYTTTFFEIVKTVLSTIWDVILTIIKTTLEVIKTVITTTWDIIKSVITTTLNVIKGIILVVWNVIKGIILTALRLITGDISGAWNAIKNMISSVINAIKGIIQSVWDGMKNIISSVMSGISSNISSVWNGIKNVISSIINAIKSMISTVFNGLKGIVSSAMNGVKSAVSTGISGALNVVTNFTSKFKDAGARIVTSIADGIKGAVGKVTGAISDVASKVRNFLPFSPPKEGPLMDIMDVKWGETIAGGIDKGKGSVAKAMDSILDFDLSKKAQFHNPNVTVGSDVEDNESDNEKQPIILQVDGKTFAQIIGDYTSEEGGNRIRKFERGLA